MTTTRDYQKQAQDFLDKFHLEFIATYVNADCPPFCKDEKRSSNRPYLSCGGCHGGHYIITIRRAVKNDAYQGHLSFPFWNSYNDQYQTTPPKAPDAYDVLSYISIDTDTDEDFDSWCDACGYDNDSRKAEALHKICLTFSAQLKAFFTENELEALRHDLS